MEVENHGTPTDKTHKLPGTKRTGSRDRFGSGWFVSHGNIVGELHTRDMMDEILERDNIESAIRQVLHNMGAEGMDGMFVTELPGYVEQHCDELYAQLRTGPYRPKPDGGERNLGVPTVLDKVVQQAVAQVLKKVYGPMFPKGASDSDLDRPRCHNRIT